MLTHPLHLNPPLNLPIPLNLSLTLPVSHLNSSKSVLQCNMNTISTLHLFFYCKYIIVKATYNIKWDQILIITDVEQLLLNIFAKAVIFAMFSEFFDEQMKKKHLFEM